MNICFISFLDAYIVYTFNPLCFGKVFELLKRFEMSLYRQKLQHI